METLGQARLRRIDWRFLLPRPFGPLEHLVLLGGSAGIAARIQEVGLARRVSFECPPDRSADAVVLLAGAALAPADVCACLMPGGLLYWELERRTRKGLVRSAGLTQSLQRMGFRSIRVYAARPSFTACESFFPLAAPRSFAWFLDTLYKAETPLKQSLEKSLRLLSAHVPHLLPSVLPDLAVVASAGPEQNIASAILASPMLPEPLQRTSLFPFIFTDGGNRLVMLPFHSTSQHPEVVVKIPKLAYFNGKNEGEQKNLNLIRAQLSPTMRRTIPEPLGLFSHGDILVALEAYLPGHSLLRSSGRWGIPLRRKYEDLDLVARWLAQFHRETERHRRPWGTAQMGEWVEAPIQKYRARFGVTNGEEKLFELMWHHAHRLMDAPFPTVWQHRDFNIWNIFRNGQELAVIDWEGGRLGPPLCDLLHFVVYWNEAVRNLKSEGARLRAFQHLFTAPSETDPISAVVQETLERYMALLKLDRRFSPLLLVYTWVELALRRFDQQQAHGETEANARCGNQEIERLGVLATHAELLFADV